MLSGFRKLKDQSEVTSKEELEFAWLETALTLTFSLLQLWLCFSIYLQSLALYSQEESQSNNFAVPIYKQHEATC